jgi:signal transduction histidine kinase/CheY-like chemotaxis protein
MCERGYKAGSSIPAQLPKYHCRMQLFPYLFVTFPKQAGKSIFMKTKTRLLLVLTAFLSLVFIMGLILQSTITREIGKVLERRIKENKQEVEKLILLDGSNITSYVNENSFWDEMLQALVKKDTGWMVNTIVTSISAPIYKANFLWVVDYDGNEVFKRNMETAPASFRVAAPDNIDLLDTLKSKTFGTYCIKMGDYYTQISSAPIVPSSDYYRKTKPAGYLIVGRIIGDQYLGSLAGLNNAFKYRFLPAATSKAEEIDIKNAMVRFQKNIFCSNDKSLLLEVSNEIPEVKVYNNFVNIALLLYNILVVLISLLAFLFFLKHFFKPLEIVSNSLVSNSEAPLAKLKNKTNEFGELAKMMITFFSQNSMLQKEIVQRKETEAKLYQALEDKEKSVTDKIKAEQSEAAKSEFLSTMSHEIRTPINGVIGIANLLKDENLTAQQKQYVEALSFSAKHLMSLVSDILDFSKIETGKVDFERVSFNLTASCESVFNLHKVNADEKKIAFSLKKDPAVTNFVYGDPLRLNQVLTNLISNAIKFTEWGGVTLEYRVATETARRYAIEFIITDTGIGIKKEEMDTVFKGFSQANTGIAKSFGGTGLGLTISKKLVELQGGTIRAESVYGKGSSFIVTLDFDKHVAIDAANSVVNDLENTSSLKGIRVLVAEDNKVNVLVIKKFLEKWGTSYKIGHTGKEAIMLAESEPFDVILMDLNMPEMDGREATQILKAHTNKQISNIPVIALTANASSETQHNLLHNGFASYISKPFNPALLFKLLKKYQ